MLIHNSPTLRHRSIRLLLSVVGVRKYKVWSQDVSQAYIQSEGLARDVYVKPHPIFQLQPLTLLKLQKPLYGLTDAGDYWSDIFSAHLSGKGEEDLGMESTTGDLSLYVKFSEEGDLERMTGAYVDDSIGCGNDIFK